MAAAERPDDREDPAPPIGGWRLHGAPPDPRLTGLVTDVVWYEEQRPGIRVREHLPGPSLALILNLADPFSSLAPDGELTTFREGEGFATGPSTLPGASRMEGVNRGVEIGLTPLGAHRLFGGRPLHELRDLAPPVGEVLGPDGARLPRELVDLGEPDAQLARVTDFLLARLGNERAAGPFHWAWSRLAGSHGTLPIHRLAQELGWSENRLVRAFRAHFGLSPKKAARLMRFARCVELATSEAPNWAELALRCGYTDQAHLAREIRAFSGSTPTELLARILPAEPETT